MNFPGLQISVSEGAIAFSCRVAMTLGMASNNIRNRDTNFKLLINKNFCFFQAENGFRMLLYFFSNKLLMTNSLRFRTIIQASLILMNILIKFFNI
jgi:hypothetical protein